MSRLDPRLRSLLKGAGVAPLAVAEAAALPEQQRVDVLLRCREEQPHELRAAGLTIRSVTSGAETFVTGSVAVGDLERIGSLPFVLQVEASRAMSAELDRSCRECGVRSVHEHADSPLRGSGVVVGIVDGGIDFTHPDFRRADGSSRILFLWDQGGSPRAGNVAYGREYTRQDLDDALGLPDPFSAVDHRDELGHGTHVAAIAAGRGGASAAHAGVAPDADLIVVATDAEDGLTLGRSAKAVEAFAYILERAAGRPVAINQSQGMNGGGHSGETVLEGVLDLFARRPGVVIVKSAGNESQWNIHAGGVLEAGRRRSLELSVQLNNQRDDVLEIWFDGADEVSVAVETPSGDSSDLVAPGDEETFATLAGNRVEVFSDANADDTGDTRVTIILRRGHAAFIQPGTWRIHLQASGIANGRYDAWVERTWRSLLGEQARFSATSADNSRTISIPGTARRVITVGSYVTRESEQSAPLGALSDFSSRGPTRYGFRKPELCAPGQNISAARSIHTRGDAAGSAGLTRQSGTSMAAPHVTGLAALLLEVRPSLTNQQAQQLLQRSARRDGAAAAAPDHSWGAGRIDAAAAVELARTARFPVIHGIQIEGSRIAWTTDQPTTGSVRFNTHRRRLQLGRALASRASLEYQTYHEIDLGDLPAATYYVEVLAFNEDSYWTLDDAGGQLHDIVIP